jgi:hypothetical protein
MTDSPKRSACQQKRKAEKSNPITVTGNKPKMVSYKPKNESLRETIKRVLTEGYDPYRLYPIVKIYQNTQNAPLYIKRIINDLKPISCKDKKGEKTTCVKISEELYNYIVGKH